MEKKKYIEPITKCISMTALFHLAVASPESLTGVGYSREQNVWEDEEEEEENTGGWFQ